MAHSALRHGRFGINVRRGARSGRTTARFDGRGRLPADNVHLQDPALQRPSASAPNAPAPRGEGITMASPTRHRVVVIGSGFGGLNAAKALKRADVDITLVAKTTSHLTAAAVPVGHRDPLGRRHRAHHAADPEAEQELQSAARRGRGHRPAGTDGHLPADGDADRTEVRQPQRPPARSRTTSATTGSPRSLPG